MPDLQYHKALLHLVGEPCHQSADRTSHIEEHLSHLPRSIAEWYSLAAADDICKRFLFGECLTPFEKLNEKLAGIWIWDNETHEEVLDARFMKIATESDGCFSLCVYLDGTDDPPVMMDAGEWIDDKTVKEEWAVCNLSFSSWLFDSIARGYLDRKQRGYWLSAATNAPTDDELGSLRQLLAEGPISRRDRPNDLGSAKYLPCETCDEPFENYRFFDRDAVLWIRNTGSERAASNWYIVGRDSDALLTMAQRVCAVRPLQRVFTPSTDFAKPSVVAEVLNALRAGGP